MRLREAVASALHLLVLVSYLFLGCLLFILPQKPLWRLALIHWLQEAPGIFYSGGILFFCVGFFFLLGFFGMGRGRFLQIKMVPHTARVDTRLIRKAVEDCFKHHFPEELLGARIAVASKNRLEIVLDLAQHQEKKQLEILQRVETKLGQLLYDRFGYKQPFTLTVHSK